MDFTLTAYKNLIFHLNEAGYSFQTFQGFLKAAANYAVILRHDVDERPQNALKIARVEHAMGIRATYYFRILKISNDPAVIAEIANMGHEIGYHYEDLALAGGDVETAIRQFSENLAYFRRFYPVETICMHGSPMSRIDNLDLWQTHDYKALGIVGEPYLDVNFSQVFYLTDTGRRWNHAGVSIRDRVDSGFDIQVNSTGHLMELARQGLMPEQIMINTHPQRWEDRALPWVKELVWQNIKNWVKWGLVKLES